MSQLTPQESFRLGFLLRCAEEGCDMQEVNTRIKLARALRTFEKTAAGAGDIVNAVKGLAGTWAKLPFHLAGYGIVGGGLLGAGTGYGLAKMRNEDVDPEEAKRQELITAYKMQAEQARRRAQQRTYRQNPPMSPQLLSGD